MSKYIVYDLGRKIQMHCDSLEIARENARGLSYVRESVSIGEEKEDGIQIIERWKNGSKVLVEYRSN